MGVRSDLDLETLALLHKQGKSVSMMAMCLQVRESEVLEGIAYIAEHGLPQPKVGGPAPACARQPQLTGGRKVCPTCQETHRRDNDDLCRRCRQLVKVMPGVGAGQLEHYENKLDYRRRQSAMMKGEKQRKAQAARTRKVAQR